MDMSVFDAWLMAGIAFVGGGFAGGALQLWFVNRDLDRLATPSQEERDDR